MARAHNADRAGGVAVPDIITDAPAAIFRAMAADRTGRHWVKPPPVCMSQNIRTLMSHIMRSYHVRKICAQLGGFMTVYGYARVSTTGQTLAAQEATLHEAGAAKVL